MGLLIPAGTGMAIYKEYDAVPIEGALPYDGHPAPEEVPVGGDGASSEG